VLVVLAGELSETLDHDDETPLPLTPQRVDDDPPQRDPGPPRLPVPVVWQEADAEPEWPERPQSDADQVHRLTAGIASSEEERAALEHALRLRAEAMVNTGHFKALHAHLTDALEARGELHASEVRRELQRAEVRFLTNTIPEADYGSQAA
jgi:hypothetical protein